MTLVRIWTLAALFAHIPAYPGIATAQDGTFAVTVDPIEHGSIQLDPALPESGKYSHWVNEALPPDPERWFAGATELAGSWWPDWHRWVTALSGERVPARIPGDGALTLIEDAPGSYVKIMAAD